MKTLLFAIIAFLLLFIAYVRYLEKTSVYFPEREIVLTPESAGFSFEDVYFSTQDGVQLNGWFMPAMHTQEPRATVIYFHGNAGNIGDRIDKARLFCELGLNVLLVDYRGYGKSAGSPTERGLYKDGLAAFDYLKLRSDVDLKRVIAYGASLGGVVAIELATHRDLAGLIIDSSFSSAADMAKVMYPFVPSFLLQIKMDSMQKVNHLTVPKLFFHSREDRTVPYRFGKKLFDAASEPKVMVELKGGHDEGYIHSKEAFSGGIETFLSGIGLN